MTAFLEDGDGGREDGAEGLLWLTASTANVTHAMHASPESAYDVCT